MAMRFRHFADAPGVVLFDSSDQLLLFWGSVEVTGNGSITIPGLANGDAFAFFVNPRLDDNPTINLPGPGGTTVSWTDTPASFAGTLWIGTY